MSIILRQKINHPEMELSNTIKNQWMGMFEEMMELISKKSEIQKVHLSVHESIRQELCFYGYFSLTEPMHPMKLNIYLIRLKCFCNR